MYNKLLLNQNRNLEFAKSSVTIPLDLRGDKDIIVDDEFTETVNLYNVYLQEREECTKMRLTAKVNLVASNILFNSVTEIVKNEGSDECVCLNFNPITIDTTFGKPSNYEWGVNMDECTMDTQITWNGDGDKDYTYLCGIDIFNNHILRSKKKNNSYYYSGDTYGYQQYWNTLKEYKYTMFGLVKTKWQNPNFGSINKYERKYRKNDVFTFFESIEVNLQKNNGWLGFLNKSQVMSSCNNTHFGNERVVNNIMANQFIDMFPGRSRFDFLPHYNKYRKRYEKNWEHCLTYPCGSTTENIPFINSSLQTLRIAFIDENEQSDDGVYRCIIYSVSKHGLKADDTINLYRSTLYNEKSEVIEEALVVDEVIDEYTFSVYTSEPVCKRWISVFDREQESGITHSHGNIYTITLSGKTEELYASSNYINADFDDGDVIGSQNLSFAKTVDGVQCRYYVRVFSRYPNFETYKRPVTVENIYNEDKFLGVRPIDKYTDEEYELQSTVSKLGFSRNIYGENLSQIVYNDDIVFDVILDNLKRPITSLYLTFIKTNYGYKLWYNNEGGDNGASKRQSADVEWSRCFGKLNCGFELSPHLEGSKFTQGNVNVMRNTIQKEVKGLIQPQDFYNSQLSNETQIDDDEIHYKEQNKFYGDLCMYSPAECLETIIQIVFARFNTAQRECGMKEFNFVKFNEIETDENNPYARMVVSTNQYDTTAASKPEGYCYQMHYEIPIRSFATNITETNPTMFSIVEVTSGADNTFIAKTSVDNYFNNDTNLYLYDSSTAREWPCQLKNILDTNVVQFTVGTGFLLDETLPVDTYKLYNRPTIVPGYAEMVSELPGVYRWRDLVQNGFEDSNNIVPEYPFNNGCLYINKDINLFVRRQDPFGDYGLAQESAEYGFAQLTGERSPVEDGSAANANDAIKESDIKC